MRRALNRIITRLCGHGPPPGGQPASAAEPPASAAEQADDTTPWVLKIRTPMTQRETKQSLCEWTLTHLKENAEQECAVEGIWFLAAIRDTLDAHETVERLRRTTRLGMPEIEALVEDHRAPDQPVHIMRSIGDARVKSTFESATDPAFAAALTWNREDGPQRRRQAPDAGGERQPGPPPPAGENEEAGRTDMMTTSTRPAAVDDFLDRLRRWGRAEAWLANGDKPGDIEHGTDDGTRWVEVDNERFWEEDIVWLRRRVVLDCVESVAGRTVWRDWPEMCERIEGPKPPDRIDEIRMRLKTNDADGPFYMYCAAASDGPAGPAGPCSLRTFRGDDDPTPPNDATVEIATSAAESDDLDWLAALTAREHLPALAG